MWLTKQKNIIGLHYPSEGKDPMTYTVFHRSIEGEGFWKYAYEFTKRLGESNMNVVREQWGLKSGEFFEIINWSTER